MQSVETTRERDVTVLAGKQVLIIGGSSGIGLAAAKAAAKAGAHVTVAARTQARLESAPPTRSVTAPKRAPSTPATMSSVEEFFRNSVWDHVVASAGAGGRGKLPDMTIAECAGRNEHQILGLFPHWTRGENFPDRIADIHRRQARYAADAGHGVDRIGECRVEGLTRGLAVDLAPTRVNTISPGVIDTPLWDQMSAQAREAMYKKAAETLPARRIGQPEDVAQALIFMMTNPFATGTVLHLEGGALLV